MLQVQAPWRWLQQGREVRELAAWKAMVRRRWAGTVEGAHLANYTATAAGAPHVAAPWARSVDEGPPVTLRVQMLLGQVLADFQAQSDRLAEGMGAARVRITQDGPGWIEVVLLEGEPLAAPGLLPTRAAGTSARVPVALGTDEYGQDVTVDFGQRVHLIVQGRTGSGKSRLSYVILQQLAAAPDAIIAGSDPSSVLLRPFRGSRHARWQVLGCDVAAHADLLTELVAEMDDRLAAIPDRCDVLPLTSGHPVIFVVLEEWLALLGLAGGDKKLRDRITLAVRRLAAEAGKVNFRLIMLAQRAEANELGGGLLRGQFAYRLTLPVDNVESIRLLHPTVAASVAHEHVTHGKPGVAIYQAPGVGLGRLQTPWIDDYSDYWDAITALTASAGRSRQADAQGLQPGDDCQPAQLALSGNDGIVAEHGSTSPINHCGSGCGHTR